MRKTNEYKNHGIDKEEAVKKLQTMGYEAFYEDGIIKINTTEDDFDAFCKHMEKVMNEIDYRQSRGYKEVG